MACADRHCDCGIRYPVRCDWPDDWEFRSIHDLRGLSRVIGGYLVRPALTLEFDPFEITDGDERSVICQLIRQIFGQAPARGVTMPGSATAGQLPSTAGRIPPNDFSLLRGFTWFWVGVMLTVIVFWITA